jgi:Holliday junction resolvase RusA-like endonuclease
MDRDWRCVGGRVLRGCGCWGLDAMTHTYTILGIPRSGKNSQRIMRLANGRRFVKKSKAASAWLAEAERQLIEQRGRRHKLTGRVAVEMVAYQKADICDIDNMICLVLDGLKNVVMGDDSEVGRVVADKFIDRVRPRVEVTIRQLGAA